jgi:hypothetical protein
MTKEIHNPNEKGNPKQVAHCTSKLPIAAWRRLTVAVGETHG